MDPNPLPVHPSSDLLITGVPRSGTTLATAIVDGLEDALALSEPVSEISLLESADAPVRLVEGLLRERAAVRVAILRGEAVPDRRAADAAALTDYFVRGPDGVKHVGHQHRVSRAGLSSGFLLATKHNALYASVLDALVQSGKFSVLAMVRNPVRIILSWQGLPIPVAQGRLPAGEKFWPELRAATHPRLPVLERQVAIIELFFARFLRLREHIALIRYEDLVRDPGCISRHLGRSIRRPVVINESIDMSTTAGDLPSRIRSLLLAGAPSVLQLYPDLQG